MNWIAFFFDDHCQTMSWYHNLYDELHSCVSREISLSKLNRSTSIMKLIFTLFQFTWRLTESSSSLDVTELLQILNARSKRVSYSCRLILRNYEENDTLGRGFCYGRHETGLRGRRSKKERVTRLCHKREMEDHLDNVHVIRDPRRDLSLSSVVGFIFGHDWSSSVVLFLLILIRCSMFLIPKVTGYSIRHRTQIVSSYHFHHSISMIGN